MSQKYYRNYIGKKSSLSFVLISLFLFFYSGPIFCQEKYPSLKMQGEIYLNACLEDKKTMLKKNMLELKYPDEEKAWKLIDTILCADNNEISRSYVKNLIPDKLRKADLTGVKPKIKLLQKNEDLINKLLASGKAWNPSVQINEDKINEKEIVLQYFANEACVKGLKIKHMVNKWILYEISEACD
jgi:hypothetical protein